MILLRIFKAISEEEMIIFLTTLPLNSLWLLKWPEILPRTAWLLNRPATRCSFFFQVCCRGGPKLHQSRPRCSERDSPDRRSATCRCQRSRGTTSRRGVELRRYPPHFPDFGIPPGRPLVQDQERVRRFAGSWPGPTGFSAKVVLACWYFMYNVSANFKVEHQH